MKIKNSLFFGLLLVTLTSVSIEGMNILDNLRNLNHKRISIGVRVLKTIDQYLSSFQLMISKNRIVHQESLGTNQLIVLEGELCDVNICGCINRNSIDYEEAEKIWLESKDIFYMLLPKLGDNKRVIVEFGIEGSSNITSYGSIIKIGIQKTWYNETRSERMFTLAHEISHYLLGHTSNDNLTKMSIVRGESLNEYYAKSQAEEKEADLNAAQMLGNAQGGIAFFNRRQKLKLQNEGDIKKKLREVANIDESTLSSLEGGHEHNCDEIIKSLRCRIYNNYQLSFMQKIRNVSSLFALKNDLGWWCYRKPTTHPTDSERIAYLQVWEQNHKRT